MAATTHVDNILPAATATAPRAARQRNLFGTAIWFLLPSALGLFAFLVFPLIASLVLSFTNWTLLGKPSFVGLRNYVTMSTVDPVFWNVVGNTLLYTVEYLTLNLVLSVGLAVWITNLKWGKRLFRLIFFLPTFTPMIGVGVVWLLIFSPGGLADWVFATLNLSIGNIVTQPKLAMQAIVIASLWSHFGYNLLLFGAALEAIPRDYVDAAAIDGATPWQRFWRIKLPLISPTLFFGTVMTAITSLQVFDLVFALTHGGPGSATSTLGYAIYSNGFGAYRMGYASAIAWFLFAIIMALTAFQLRLQRRWVHYDL